MPSIIATIAEYAEDPVDQLALYKEAYSSACEMSDAANKTMISSSVAELYLGELRERAKARFWLELFDKNRKHYTDSYFDELFAELKLDLGPYK